MFASPPTFHPIALLICFAFQMDSLLGCCNPVPPLIRVHSQDIILLIKKAKTSVAPVRAL